MAGAAVVLVVGGVLLLTALIIVVRPIGGPVVLAVVALLVACAAWVVSGELEHGNDVEVVFAGLLRIAAVAHVLLSGAFLGVAWINQQQHERVSREWETDVGPNDLRHDDPTVESG